MKTSKVVVFEPELPYNCGSVSPGTNQSYSTSSLIVYFNNPFVYDEAYRYSTADGTFAVLSKYEPTGPRFAKEKYSVENALVPSKTGEYIPMTIISPKKRSVSKMVLHFYGFYGLSS